MKTSSCGLTVFAGLVCSLWLVHGTASGEGRYERWQASKPFTIGAMYYDLAYGPHWYDPPPPDLTMDPDMEQFRAAGLNLLDDVSMSAGGHLWYPGVRAAREAGVPFMILGGPWAPMEFFQHRVAWFAGDTTFYGVQLADEPRDPEQQQFHREQQEWIEKEHPQLLTLICESLTDIPGWTSQWEAIRCDALIFQWYPYHTSDGGSPDVSPAVYACLAHASAFCKSQEIGFFMARETAVRKTESTLRLNTYASLAYGCDGFLDWEWGSTESEGGYVWYKDKRGQGPAANYESLAQINKEVAHLGHALLALRHVRTYHLNWPTHETWAGTSHDFKEKDDLRTGKLVAVRGVHHPYGDPLMVGFFRDSLDEEYFMVVNKANSRSLEVDSETLTQSVTLVLREDVSALQRLDRETGQVETVELVDHTFSFTLPGGTGDLFKYAGDNPFAGVGRNPE